MSLVEQFEYLLARRSSHKSYQMNRGKSTQPSNTVLSFTKLSQSIYEEAFVQKINSSPCKGNIQKFQELRKKLATRASERCRRGSIKSTNKDSLQANELIGSTMDLIPNSLLCSKAVMHLDYRTPEGNWKKVQKQLRQEEPKSKCFEDDVQSTTNFVKPKRRFSQDIQGQNFSSTIFVGKHTRLKTSKRMSEIVTGSTESPEQRSSCQSYRIKCSPRKQGSNKSDLTKETKCSENEFGFDRIDPWASGIADDEDIIF